MALLTLCLAAVACGGSGEAGSPSPAGGSTGGPAGSGGGGGASASGGDSVGGAGASTGGSVNTGGSVTAAGAPPAGGSAGNGGGEAGGGAGAGGAGVGGTGVGGAGAGGGAGVGGVGGGGAGHPNDAVEFNGHFYRFTKASISGAQAQAICESTGGYLACIETESENAFLLTLAGTARPWFGLNNLANVNDWVWINGSPVSYKHWQPGQPDNPANEHWGKLLEDGSWDDGSVETSYICEWDR